MIFSVVFSQFFKDKQHFLCNLFAQQAQLCLRAFINLQPMKEMQMMNIQLFSADKIWQGKHIVMCIIHHLNKILTASMRHIWRKVHPRPKSLSSAVCGTTTVCNFIMNA